MSTRLALCCERLWLNWACSRSGGWKRDGADTPSELRGFGSPTIVVNGVDVGGNEEEDVSERANCCRLYQHHGRLRGVPELGTLTSAIIQHVSNP